MRLRTPALAASAVTALLLVPAAPAQAPARAGAIAEVAAGDLGTVGRASVRDGGRDSAVESAARSGMEIGDGRASVRASRAGGDATARATATAERVSLFDGLVTAERVSRTATAADGGVTYDGSVTGLVVNGVEQGDRRSEHSWSSGGARVTVNRDGEGLRVRLTRAVAGFASGTRVVVAGVSAEAVDGADPAATPQPAPTVSPDPEPTATPEPAEPAKPAKPRITPEQRLARGRFVFPVYGDARVADDFGAARQIGAHQGNDIFASFGSPVLAVADGKLNRVGTLPISGNRLWLKTERGDAFFYAHMSAFGPEAVSGRAGEGGHAARLRRQHRRRRADAAAPALRDPPRRPQGDRPARRAGGVGGARRGALGRLAGALRQRHGGAPGRAGRGARLHRGRMRSGDETAERALGGEPGDETADEPTRAQRMKERLAERRESHVQRGRFYRVGFTIVGATVTLAGIAMLVTPGPAFVVIPIGLAMLALEFAWAERMLDRALDQADIAAPQGGRDDAHAADPRRDRDGPRDRRPRSLPGCCGRSR